MIIIGWNGACCWVVLPLEHGDAEGDAFVAGGRDGNENSAYSFNGINNWIEIPFNESLQINQITQIHICL